MKKIFLIFVLLATVTILIPPAYSQSNNVTFTTYYPAPFGAYDRLMLQPRALLTAGACIAATEGTLYVDTTNHTLNRCRNIPPGSATYTWGQVAQEVWTQDVINNWIYPTDTTTNPNLNVGIGVTSPDSKLTVQADAGTGAANSRPAQIRLHGRTNPANKLEIGYDTTGNFAVIGALTEGVAWRNIALANNGGNVGIGVTNPLARLHVQGPDNLAGTLGFRVSDSSGNPLFAVQDNGNVGIGVTAPTNKLQIQGGGGGTVDLQVNGRIQTGDVGNLGGVWLDSAQTMFVGNDTTGVKMGFWGSGAGFGLLMNKTSGNVGIGVTAPAQKLDVNGVGQFSGNTQIGNGILQGYYGDGTNLAIRAYNAAGSDIYFQTYNGAATNMIIKHNGRVGIGNTSPQAKLDITTNTTGWGGWYTAIEFSQGAHSAIIHPGGGLLFGLHSDRHFYWADTIGGKYVMELDANAGNLWVLNTITAGSDARLKKNVVPLKNVLPKLEQINGVYFEWNELARKTELKKGQKHIGLIAQDLQKVYPELVVPIKTPDQQEEYLAVDYEKFTAVLLQAVKELKGEVDSLNERIKILEKQK